MGAIAWGGRGGGGCSGEGAVDTQAGAAGVPGSVPGGSLGLLEKGLHDGYAFCLGVGAIDEMGEMEYAI
jgi:hypothetical protein